MRYKVHILRPNQIPPSYIDGLGHAPIGLIDAELHDADPVEVASALDQYRPGMPILFFARTESTHHFVRGAKIGVLGTVQKSDEPGELLRKLDCAIQKQNLWDKEEMRRFQTCTPNSIPTPGLDIPLTQRESDVLCKLSLGLTNKKIAEELGISHQTVKGHIQQILHKIGVNDRTQAAVWAVRNRLF